MSWAWRPQAGPTEGSRRMPVERDFLRRHARRRQDRWRARQVGAQREALATRPAHGPWSRSSFIDAEAAPTATPQGAQADALVAEPRAQLADMQAQRDAWQRVAERSR